MQPELHQFILEAVVEHEHARKNEFEEMGGPVQVFCHNGPFLNLGHCEIEKGLITCHGYDATDDFDTEMSKDTWLSVPYLSLQHSTCLANMATTQNSAVHHLLDSAIRSSMTFVEQHEGKVLTPLSEYLLGVITQIRTVMREQTATCVEQSEHALYTLRDAATLSFEESAKQNILLQTLLQGDRLFEAKEQEPELPSLDTILADLRITEPPPPDIKLEVSITMIIKLFFSIIP